MYAEARGLGVRERVVHSLSTNCTACLIAARAKRVNYRISATVIRLPLSDRLSALFLIELSEFRSSDVELTLARGATLRLVASPPSSSAAKSGRVINEPAINSADVSIDPAPSVYIMHVCGEASEARTHVQHACRPYKINWNNFRRGNSGLQLRISPLTCAG